MFRKDYLFETIQGYCGGGLLETFENELGKIFYYDKEELIDSLIIVEGIKFHYDRDEININDEEVKKDIQAAVKEAKENGFNNYSIAKVKVSGEEEICCY